MSMVQQLVETQDAKLKLQLLAVLCCDVYQCVCVCVCVCEREREREGERERKEKVWE